MKKCVYLAVLAAFTAIDPGYVGVSDEEKERMSDIGFRRLAPRRTGRR